MHTVPFVRKFHSVGLFNEQALESVHHVMSVDEKKFIHLNKMQVMKTKLMMDHQNIRQGFKNKKNKISGIFH